MEKITYIFTRYPLSLLALAGILFLTLYKPSGNMPSIPGLDKVVHFFMYASLCSVILFEYFKSHVKADKKRIFWFAIIMPILFSGVMEILQSCLTTYRSGDFVDFIFNVLGIVFAALLWHRYAKHKR
mgnify:CR=1 FL=1